MRRTIERAPDFSGRARAWRLRPAPEAPEFGNLASYLVHWPRLHPAWDCWLVGLVHLREVPGVRPPTRRYAAAAYQIASYALDPNFEEPDPDCWRPGQTHLLTPADVAIQFHGPASDAEALRLFETLIQACAAGGLPPDADFRGAWRLAIESAPGLATS